LNDGDKDVTVSVCARPLASPNAAYNDITKDNAKKLQQDLQAEIAKEFEKLGNLNADATEFFAAPVYELKYEGSYYGETTTYQFLELRFVHDGIVYSVIGTADQKYFKDYVPRMRDAFAGFSFLPAVGADDDAYSDLIQGFAIDRPSPRWKTEARPFDNDKPVTFRNEDQRAFVKALLTEANGATASSFADKMFKEYESKSGFNKI